MRSRSTRCRTSAPRSRPGSRGGCWRGRGRIGSSGGSSRSCSAPPRRIGEVLAIRLQDLDLDGPIPTARIAGTIISRKGEPTHRQDHPKTDRSVRRVALPSFALQAIRSRLLRSGDTEAGDLLFITRVRTPHTTNNIRRLLRDVMEAAGIENVTPHRFRCTVATVVNDAQGALLATELLGPTDPRITMQHYIQRSEAVKPAKAEHLERAFGMAG